MAKEKAAIVIHVYKEQLSPYERISLMQLRRVLGNYPVIITAPPDFSAKQYQIVLGDQLREIIHLPGHYFKGLAGYNRLMQSKAYYKNFTDFEYILLYHTDAFVFRDELNEWISRDFDYIGAPIYHYDGTMNPAQYRCVGNGGFSLRKVETFIRLADSGERIYKWRDVLADFLMYNWRGRISRMPYYFGLLSGRHAKLNSNRSGVRENEDIIWGYYVPKYISPFKIASFEDAYRFSMEFNCDKLMEKNNGELPFGCHGWYRSLFIDFWSPYIKAQGFNI
jgi:hypothetical protein